MRSNFFRQLVAVICGLGLSAITYASVTYVVRKGDKLSKVVGKMIQGPVWGKQGSLSTVLALNPEIKNPNLIYPGQELKLPGEVVAQTKAPAPEQTSAAEGENPSPEIIPDRKVAETPPTSNEISSGAKFEVAPYYALTTLNASDKTTGSPATIASSVNVGVDIRYYQLWSEHFKSFVHLRLGTLGFEQPTVSTSTLQSASNFMSGIGIGGDYQLSRPLTFRVTADDQKEVFVRGISTNSVAIDAVTVPELAVKLSYDLFNKNDLMLGVSGQSSLLFQASTEGYTASYGSLYGGTLYLKQDLGGSPLYTEVGYFSRQQNTSIANQTEKDIVLQLRWGFH